jgi:hypothetical protein
VVVFALARASNTSLKLTAREKKKLEIAQENGSVHLFPHNKFCTATISIEKQKVGPVSSAYIILLICVALFADLVK